MQLVYGYACMYLNIHTHFSLRYGIMSPAEALDLCRSKGVVQAAFTDINNTSACLDILRLAPRYGVSPCTGIDFRNGAAQCYVGIARNNNGFRNLNEHLSRHLHTELSFGRLAPEMDDVYIIYPFSAFQTSEQEVKTLPENSFIGVSSADLGRFRFSFLARHTTRCVILETVTFRNKTDFNTHRLLRAIDNNILLSKLSKNEEGSPEHRMREPLEIEEIFSEFPEMIYNTRQLLKECRVFFPFGDEASRYNLSTYTGSEDEDYALIRKLSLEGLTYRYSDLSTDRSHESADKKKRVVLDRIEKELHIIREKGFLSYFLINWDITSYARSKGYFYVGRGSGANSIIAYLLRITDVDPIDLDLYFERFINLYRKNPPDFDIDFSWTDRDDITRYIFERFPHVALVGAYNTFQYKAVVRELGKVFGLPKYDIDTLSDGRFIVSELDHLQQLVLKYSTLIQDFPNIISPHSCGILIADIPIHSFTATLLPPKGYPTTHFDMIVAEDVGLYKFDILSQRGLGKIKDTLTIIRRNHPGEPAIDIHDMPRFKHDERIRDLLRTARAIGCFYVESPAMRMLLKKLQVDDYLGLVAASSVIRPGVSSSGMMKEYILRHRDPERRKKAHPVLLDIMPETYGVMVYQEDVIKVAHYFAGLDLGEADSLRRGMSGKFRGREEFDRARQSFFQKALEKGHDPNDIAEIWRQTESFAGYAFAKGHSASYAVESYQSLFLKAYYPLEYMTATINNFGGFYSTELYAHEARLHGARIEGPCVNYGGADSYISGQTITLGMGLVSSLEHQVIEDLMRIRHQDGPYESLDDFLNRVPVSLEQTCILIRSGAFRFTGRNKKDLLWETHFRLGKVKTSRPETFLFPEPARTFALPPLTHTWLEDAYDEIELLGFPLCNPFDLLAEEPGDAVPAAELHLHIGKTVTVVGYLVTTKVTRTSRNERMYFGTFVDRAGAFLDTVHFPPVAERYPWRGKGIYELRGKVTEDFDAISIETEWMQKLPYQSDPRYADLNTTTRIRLGLDA